ncbi:unnamed protein product [Ostreobium quekettii]|uniref:Uncharacterized protein n=1 Tax=Ostreobium quekettii TaxID=121088 RepID=A0A8S1JDZ5_9CHLO|nr:unnamed protein product [Ostreobium quekettii]|eukprot:evm.model.scf_1331.4 EVM.evm.TU.scf_1331.4   scf_1331:31045-39405(+)
MRPSTPSTRVKGRQKEAEHREGKRRLVWSETCPSKKRSKALGGTDVQQQTQGMVTSLELELAAGTQELQATTREFEPLDRGNRSETAKIENAICQEELAHCQNAIRVEQVEKAALQKRVAQLERSQQELEAENVEMKEEAAQAQRLQKDLKAKNMHLEDRVSHLERRNLSMQEENENLKKRIAFLDDPEKPFQSEAVRVRERVWSLWVAKSINNIETESALNKRKSKSALSISENLFVKHFKYILCKM